MMLVTPKQNIIDTILKTMAKNIVNISQKAQPIAIMDEIDSMNNGDKAVIQRQSPDTSKNKTRLETPRVALLLR